MASSTPTMADAPAPSITHDVQIRVIIHDRAQLERDGQALFAANGGDLISPRSLSEHVTELLTSGNAPSDHGFEILRID